MPETVWLTQKRMAELYNVDRTVVTKHLINIIESGELEENSVSAIFAHTANDNKVYKTRFYNLDAIISVGYRVNSIQATAFRKWATSVLKEFLIKGFVMDDARLAQGSNFGKDYFDELLERVREIRLSERRIYLKLTDIFALSNDYNSASPLAKQFFAFIQNKLHYAIAGGTAAEIIHARADKSQPHMGLTNWRQAPNGKDFADRRNSVAKNYLKDKELSELRLAVSAFWTPLNYGRSAACPPPWHSGWALWMATGLKRLSQAQNAGAVSKQQAETKGIRNMQILELSKIKNTWAILRKP